MNNTLKILVIFFYLCIVTISCHFDPQSVIIEDPEIESSITNNLNDEKKKIDIVDPMTFDKLQSQINDDKLNVHNRHLNKNQHKKMYNYNAHKKGKIHGVPLIKKRIFHNVPLIYDNDNLNIYHTIPNYDYNLIHCNHYDFFDWLIMLLITNPSMTFFIVMGILFIIVVAKICFLIFMVSILFCAVLSSVFLIKIWFKICFMTCRKLWNLCWKY